MRRVFGYIMGWVMPAVLAAIMLLMLLRPEAALNGARGGLTLWAVNVLPALLPYFILTQVLVASGALRAAGRGLTPLTRALFRLPGEAGPALLLSWVSGSPAGARISGQLLEQGTLDRRQAARLCACAASTGPIYIVGSVGNDMLGDSRAGALLLCACLTAAFLNGILWRGYGPYGNDNGKVAEIVPKGNALAELPSALRDGFIAVLVVGAGITLFSVISQLLFDIGIFGALASLLSPLMGEEVALAVLSGVFELTGGCRAAASLSIPLGRQVAIIAGFAGFGGLCVLTQAAFFLRGGISIGIYFLERVTQAALGYLAAFALSPLFLNDIPASTKTEGGGWCGVCIAVFLLAVIVAFLSLRAFFPPFRRFVRKKTAWGTRCNIPNRF